MSGSTAQPRTPSLDGCRVKLSRAGEHIGLASEFIQRDTPYIKLIQERSLDSEKQTLRVTVRIAEVPSLPEQWSAVIGDAIQNIRAALDYLVYELIALENAGAYYEMSQFPIASAPGGHSGQRSQETIRRLGRHWQVIEKYQPYAAGDPPSLWDEALAFLADFSNQDKHRLLVPVGSSVETNVVAILTPSSEVRRLGRGFVNAGVLETGAVLAWEDFQVISGEGSVYMNDLYRPLVSFPDVSNIGAGELLTFIHRKASALLGEFKSLFPPA